MTQKTSQDVLFQKGFEIDWVTLFLTLLQLMIPSFDFRKEVPILSLLPSQSLSGNAHRAVFDSHQLSNLPLIHPPLPVQPFKNSLDFNE
jgi:hypothetical protein